MTTLQAQYGDLAGQIRSRGLLRPRPGSYAAHAAIVFGALAVVIVAMASWRHSWLLLLVAPCLAIISTQIGFLGHDVGHLQVTRNRLRSRVLGLLVGNLAGGLSYGWWVRKHNAHHAHPNDPDRDPDVAAGVFVWTRGQADRRTGAAAWATRHQAALFFPLLLGEALNLHVSSIRELFAPGLRHRTAEAATLTLHFVGYAGLLVATLTWPQTIAFVAIHKGMQGLYLGTAFAPSHKGMPVLDAEQSRDPLLRQILTSRNVRGSWLTTVALGGLNYQIEHHLFPSMPRANLRLAQPVVRAFCAERGVPYVECGAFACYAAGLRHLHQVGAGVRRSVTAMRPPDAS
ncbi:acyl-CoA desaturase [Nocardioides maradonensis]